MLWRTENTDQPIQRQARDIHLDLALATARAATYEFDTLTGLAKYDASFAALFGLAPTDKTPGNKPHTLAQIESHIHADDVRQWHRDLEHAVRKNIFHLATDLRVVTEGETSSPASTLRWIHTISQIIPHESQGFRVVGLATDISDQRRADEHARESRTKMSTLLNCVPQLIWTTTANGQHIYANSRCLDYTGFDEAKKHFGWIQSIHPDDAQEVIGKWNTSMTSGEVFEAEFRLRDRKDVDTWFLGRAVPLKNEAGQITEWFGTATDIHEKKLAEARRQRIQRKVSQLQSIATALAVTHKPLEVAQLVVDQGLDAVDADAGFIVLTEPRSDYLPLLYASGYTPEQVENLKQLTIHSPLPIADAVRIRESIFLTDQKKLVPYNLARASFGLPARRAIAALPLMVQGQALGAIALSYNTEQEFTEERIGYLTILAEQCAQAIERARLFEAEQSARRKGEAASRAKTQFLTNMSHEIRTPMNSILGFSDLLGDKFLSAEEREDYRRRIRENGDQLMRLIDDVLDLSKAETGRILVTKSKLSIIDLVREIHDAMSVTTRKKGILTRITTDASVPHMIESDPIRLRQILTNLIGNSIKFTDHGRIETRISVKDSQLLIEVEDTGIGISPELHQRLFQPFVQGDSSVTRRFGGSGLGLVVSRGVAEAMGGTLDLIRTDTGNGSTFRLMIPLPVRPVTPQIDMFEEMAKQQKTLTPGRELEGVQVLLVEDSVDNEMLIRAYLKGTGVELEVAHNGEEAVDRALDRDFDMVFMDIQMPVMDGLEATRRLIDQNYDKPIVALSAHALPEEVERSLAAGCHSHLTKPIMRNVLIEQIRSLRHLASPVTETIN